MPKTVRSKALGLLAAGAVASLVSVAATPAHASLEIQLQSGSAIWNQTGAGPLSVSQSIGHFDFTSNTGLFGAGPSPSLDLSSLNMSSFSGGTLIVTLSQNDLTDPLGPSDWLTQFSGNFVSGSASVKLQTYIDLTNTLLGTGTLLGTLNASGSPGSGSPFALASSNAVTTTGPFALTEVLTIHARGRSTTSLDSSITAVPEPASLALLGSALFGIGMVRRRRNGQA